MAKVKFKKHVTYMEQIGQGKASDSNRVFATSTTNAIDVVRNSGDYAGVSAVQKINVMCGFTDEMRWHCLGRPYYKVYRDMAVSLIDTSIGIKPCDFRTPYSAFSVMLPSGLVPGIDTFLFHCFKGKLDSSGFIVDPQNDGVLSDCGGTADSWAPIGHSVGFVSDKESKFGPVKMLCRILWNDSSSDGKNGGRGIMPILVCENETLGHAMDHMIEDVVDFSDGGAMVQEGVCSAFKIAAGVAMFAVNRHSFISPDMEMPKQVMRGKKKKVFDDLAKENALASCVGWKVGSEMSLPRGYHLASRASGTGKKLQFGHIRSGHMRMQPHGPHNSLRKLIFIPPTLVKPKLPMKTQHGYSIGEKDER